LRTSTALNLFVVSWQWYVLIGSLTTIGAAWIAQLAVDGPGVLRRELQ
jgi:hypothetical protein